MYYTLPEKKPIGQAHFKGKDKGQHFTWTMFPLDFCNFVTTALYNPAIVDEYGHELSVNAFVTVVEKVTSQSFEEGLE